MQGVLVFRYGTMGSAKTVQAITQAYALSVIGRSRVFVMKPTIDTRDASDKLVSRTGLTYPCTPLAPDYLFPLKDFGGRGGLFTIIIDEAQFLTPEQVDSLERLVIAYQCDVYCYGLKTNFKRKLFPASKRLIEIADKIEEIPGLCRLCGSPALYNAKFQAHTNRLITGEGSEGEEDGKDGDEIQPGGDELYKPLCKRCYSFLYDLNLKGEDFDPTP